MKTIAICGSRRFKPEIRKFSEELRKKGVTVYEPYLHSGQQEWENLSKEYQKFIALGLTHDHFYKIRMADVVFIFNKDGYSGNSTTLEIGCAVAMGKPIYALSDKDEELARKVLFREIIASPEELFEKLK
jgi:nucleoside 2-deoxyribosyltransferase